LPFRLRLRLAVRFPRTSVSLLGGCNVRYFFACALKKRQRTHEGGGDACARDINSDAQAGDRPWLGGDCVSIGTDWVKSPQTFIVGVLEN
jgi:hypothetical protein